MAMQDKIANTARILRGKAKEAAGRVTRNPRLEIEGRFDQGVGHLRQAGQNMKNSGKDLFGC